MFESINDKSREVLFRKIIEAIRSSLDLKIVKQKIVSVIGNALNADRCFILEYDKINDKFLKIKDEYLSTSTLPSYIGIDFNENIPRFTSEFKKGKSLLFNQTKALLNGQEIDLNDACFEAEKNAIEYYKVYSALVFPIYYTDNFLGDLILHYVDKKHEAGEDEVNLLKDLASQIALALHQSSLYNLVKKNEEREVILRKLIETIRTTIDLDESKQLIVKAIGETLNADRCFITDYDHNENKFLPIKTEYLSSDKIISTVGQDVHEIVPGFIEALKSGKYLLIKNKEIFIDFEKQDFTIEQETLQKFDTYSTFAIPLIYKKEFLGVLSVHYADKDYEIGDFEINLMKDIANQVAMSINQANLYETIQKTAKKEFLLRKIIESSRKYLNFETNSKEICKSISELFGVDRVSIGKKLIGKVSDDFIYTEYIKREEIKKAKSNIDFSVVVKYWQYYLLENTQIKPINNINESDLPEKIKKTYQEIGVKSIIFIPLGTENNAWGGLFLSAYDSYTHWTKEQIELLETAATHIYSALRQSELFEKQKELAEREKLLREITKSIRNSIDIEKTKRSIVDTIGKALNADRCFILEYNKTDDIFENVEYEYLSSNDIMGLIGANPQVEFPVFAKAIKMGKTLLVQNCDIILDYENQDFSVEIQSLEKYGYNSGYVIPIYYKNELLGLISVHYVKENRTITNDEINLLQTISNQIAIALHQSKLYNDIIVYSERDKISKNIIEILRSSIDKSIIKKLFVRNIGEFFNADRVFFSEYDNKTNNFIPIDKDSEYLSSPDEMSFIGIDLQNKTVKDYYNLLLEKREIKIFSIEDYIIEKQLTNEDKYLMELGGAKSSYSFPIFYQDKVLGYFCIHFTHNKIRLSDEDINRIRNMCAQAGIALYHAEILTQAQDLGYQKSSYIKNMTTAVIEITENLNKLSEAISKTEIKCENCNLYLRYLNEIVTRIADFVQNIQN